MMTMSLHAQVNETHGWKKIDPKNLNENATRLIGDDWMLVSAGTKDHMNMMTASWGGLGNLWNKPVAFIFIRPQRYTFQFLEKNDRFVITFFPQQYKEALVVCGSVSGKDVNKVEKSGLTPLFTENGSPAFSEARIIIECKKIYADFIDEKSFIDASLVPSVYPEKDFHKMYIGEILNCWVKE